MTNFGEKTVQTPADILRKWCNTFAVIMQVILLCLYLYLLFSYLADRGTAVEAIADERVRRRD